MVGPRQGVETARRCTRPGRAGCCSGDFFFFRFRGECSAGEFFFPFLFFCFLVVVEVEVAGVFARLPPSLSLP